MLFWSIVIGIAVAIGAFAAAMQLNEVEGFDDLKAGARVGGHHVAYHVVGSVSMGLVVGLINYFSPRVASVLWLAPMFLTIMVGFIIGLVVWWCREGSTIVEMVPFLELLVLFFFTTKAAATATTALWTSPFWDSVVSAFVWILVIVSLGIIIASWAKFRFVTMADDDQEEPEYDDEDE